MNQTRTIRRRLAAAIRRRDPDVLDTAAKWRVALARSSDVEYMQLLESENARLESENRALEEHVQPQLATLPELYVERLNAIDLERKLMAVEAVRADIEQLPEDLTDVIRLIERLYPDRIVFCGGALESARVAKINQVSGGIGIAWRLLRALAVVLHDLYLGGAADVARRFQDRSGFELALGEGSSTRQDAELMRRRFVQHDGAVIDIGAHAKYGHREPRLLRVHYGFCVHCLRLVVGHCGDHLPTAGSRRRK
ncbi:MAG TPA: hypothetical protein VG963_14870 [Polyangiaceae bacterium]|nr:hypothetical protein [Polyangiaceae bacterium]